MTDVTREKVPRRAPSEILMPGGLRPRYHRAKEEARRWAADQGPADGRTAG